MALPPLTRLSPQAIKTRGVGYRSTWHLNTRNPIPDAKGTPWHHSAPAYREAPPAPRPAYVDPCGGMVAKTIPPYAGFDPEEENEGW